ncbi:MAG: protein kinase [Sandaracinaceae bacterium]
MSAPSHAASGRIVPGVRVGSYLIERLLGTGGMGSVFAARHVGLDKPVAVKTLHESLAAREESVRRFVREGRAASKIRHPHVVDVTDVGTHEGLPYLVMEYLEGEDLHTRLDACGRLTPREIARIMLPVIDALAYAHDAGVIHRDLKPSNIFLARGPYGEVPKILDFGIARILDMDKLDAQTITVAASYLGTPYYSSPEQAKSGGRADAMSDQYSIGAIIYELAAGAHGLVGETPFEILSAIVANQRVPITTLAAVDTTIAAITERAMAYESHARYPSVRELGQALLRVADPEVARRWSMAFTPRDLMATVGSAENVPPVPSPPEPAAARAPAFTPPGSLPGVGNRPISTSGVIPIGRDGSPSLEPSQPNLTTAGAPSPLAASESSQPGLTRPSAASLEAAAAPPSVHSSAAAPTRSSGTFGKLAFAAIAGLVVAGGTAGGLFYARGGTWPPATTEDTADVAAPPPPGDEVDPDSQVGVGGGIAHVIAEGAGPEDGSRSADDGAPTEPIDTGPIESGPTESGPTESGPTESGPTEAEATEGEATETTDEAGEAAEDADGSGSARRSSRRRRGTAWWGQHRGGTPESVPYGGAGRTTSTPHGTGSGTRFGTNGAPIQR